MQKAYFDSPVGVLEICGDEQGVSEINFVREFKKTQVTDANLKLCLRELEEYFTGKLQKFSTKLNIGGSKFQKSVYEALINQPYGETITYGELALIAGSPRACRAVGSANAKNKIPILIPCHRVVGANGLGGYSGGEGLKTKKFLLDLERKFSKI